MFHVPESSRVTNGPQASDSTYGNNGAFVLKIKGEMLYAIASDGLGWEHVSISFINGDPRRTPSWRQMCEVKALFWDAEDAVMQLHPPESSYISNHPGCLHLWRPTDCKIPLPSSLLVGTKGIVNK